ncbi:cytochrome P450 [Vararia minispora EC-137]|uniref:Cytochrome P450 n=1 Tax=Vararia minispora EC-137 TaxID=1314806 RepID=A0ACB8Q984_9AGAM|nr:cytochrome P450 [Vararia minispora EC-137]
MLDFTTVILSLIALGLLVTVRRIASRYATRALPYPPGPKGWPFIGNLLDMPRTKVWETFTSLRGQYGDIIYLSVLGQPMVIVNSAQIAQDLLDKRSSIYSDRPRMPMAGELCGYIDTLPIMPYGQRFRVTRRLMHQFMGTRTTVEKYADVEEEETARFILRILRDPRSESLEEHVRKMTGGLILKIAYDYTTQEDDDPFVKAADLVLEQFSATTAPGAFLVDLVPPLRYLPDWFPGTGFKRFARICKKEMDKMIDEPMQWARRHQTDHADRPTFVSMHDRDMISDEDQYVFKMAAGTLYGGGSDTTVSTIYSLFLALALNPDVQKKAQAEVDHVVGLDRLPTLKDREELPYIEALVKELLRWNTVVPTGIPHRLTEDDTYGGYFLPKGSIVIANVHHMLHDEATYSDPEKFFPDRFMPADGKPAEQDPLTMCFGFGRRICPGRFVAETSVFLICAMVASVLNVSKAIEDGVVVEPVFEIDGATITHPKEYRCSIMPRSAKAAGLIYASVELNK